MQFCLFDQREKSHSVVQYYGFYFMRFLLTSKSQIITVKKKHAQKKNPPFKKMDFWTLYIMSCYPLITPLEITIF